jgi:hypothetical protein
LIESKIPGLFESCLTHLALHDCELWWGCYHQLYNIWIKSHTAIARLSYILFPFMAPLLPACFLTHSSKSLSSSGVNSFRRALRWPRLWLGLVLGILWFSRSTSSPSLQHSSIHLYDVIPAQACFIWSPTLISAATSDVTILPPRCYMFSL